ncbi:MAG: VOC family protein [Roseitalea porphyridii]|jgi:catechol 2,3-dioxygenase|uniref:VOC family protein n=1 Tax=Roseitalea porphyridii TaxID=1852022 RepID=UPI0032EF148A
MSRTASITEKEAFDWSLASVRIGGVTLNVRDMNRVADFYASVLGLQVLSSTNDWTVLGADDTPLLTLVGDGALSPRDPSAAGLFHTAYLLPSRAHLARWLVHAAESGVRLEGASDHKVSEALYLSDPEGNGIEIYADRPTTAWHDADGAIAMATDPLDLEALAAHADRPWAGFPEDGFIGHVHLQVGDARAAESFYAGMLGLEVMARYPGASFFGADGYHHQLAANHWRSGGAGQRPKGQAGLAEVALVVTPDVHDRVAGTAADIEAAEGQMVLEDPWGTRIALVDKAGD